MTGAPGFLPRGLAAVTTFWLAVCAHAAYHGVKGLHRLLAHGATPAPRPCAEGRAALPLAGEGRLSGWPPDASWVDQVDRLLRHGPREGLPPNAFPRTTACSRELRDDVAELQQPPKPVTWTETTVTWLATVGTPPPNQRAASLWRLVLRRPAAHNGDASRRLLALR